MTTAPEHDLLSLSRLCELFQRTPRAIEHAAEAASAAPALRLNGTPYWDSTAAERIAEALGSK